MYVLHFNMKRSVDEKYLAEFFPVNQNIKHKNKIKISMKKKHLFKLTFIALSH